MKLLSDLMISSQLTNVLQTYLGTPKTGRKRPKRLPLKGRNYPRVIEVEYPAPQKKIL